MQRGAHLFLGPRRDHIVKDNGVGLAPKVVDSIMAMGAEGSTVESVCGLHTLLLREIT